MGSVRLIRLTSWVPLATSRLDSDTFLERRLGLATVMVGLTSYLGTCPDWGGIFGSSCVGIGLPIGMIEKSITGSSILIGILGEVFGLPLPPLLLCYNNLICVIISIALNF